MRKIVLSVLLALCIVISLLPATAQASYAKLYVGGVDVTPELEGSHYWKADDESVFVEVYSGEEYDFCVERGETAYILTLNGVDITDTRGNDKKEYGILSQWHLDIRLAAGSENTITIAPANPGSEKIYGVYAPRVNVSGQGSLSMTVSGEDIGDAYGFSGYDEISFLNGTGTVTASVYSDYSACGIYVVANPDTEDIGQVLIHDGTLSVTATSNGRGSAGIGADYIVISRGTVTAEAYGGTNSSLGVVFSDEMVVYGGTLTATAGGVTGDDALACGIFSEDSDSLFALNGGSVTATAQSDENDAAGIGIPGTIALIYGNLTASGTTQALVADEGIEVHIGTYKHRTNTTAAEPDTPYSFYPDTAFSIADVAEYKYVCIAETFAISSIEADNGSFTVTADGVAASSAAAGDTVTLTAASAQGYSHSSWSVYRTGTPSTTVAVTGNTFIMPTYPVTVSASFTQNTNNNGGGGAPSRTITVTENSSDLFSDGKGEIKATANMTSAFSTSVEVKVTDTSEDGSSFGLSAGDQVYPFDLSLYIKGTDTRVQPKKGYAVTISLPIPEELLDSREQLSILHKSEEGTVSTLNSRLTQIEGVWYLVFEATEFSPYALVVQNAAPDAGETGLPCYLDAGGNKVFIGFAANGKYIAPRDVTVLFTENSKNFVDVSGHWAAGYIGFVTEREIFLGTGSNTFSADTGMTRGMFATVIGRLYERSYGEIKASGNTAFTDCSDEDYYGKYVDWAAEKDIISGYGDNRFGPEDAVTREQMAAILYRFADFLDVLPKDMDIALDYPDSDSISGWAADAAGYCQTAGIISGRSGGVFAPQETATRAEVAAIIQRFVESVVK